MKRENFKPFSKKALFTLFIAFTVTAFSGCSSDDDEPASPDSPNNKVTINADGTASGGTVFHRIDETTFFLDYVKYKIVDSHLNVIGYDWIELPKEPKLYAEVNIDGVSFILRNIYGLNDSHITSITIPSTVIDFEFWECTSIKSVVISKGVTRLPWQCFKNCTSLTEIKIPDSVEEIESSAFWACTSLSEVKIPDGVTKLREYCFYDCSSLTEIKIPESVIDLGKYCFHGCISLTEIKIPESVTKLGEYCFSYCSSLTKIKIPDSATVLGDRCFVGCSSLSNIELSNNLYILGNYCFSTCSQLKSITFKNDVPSKMSSSAFSGMNCHPVAYVPKKFVENYKSKLGNYFSEIIGY